MSPTGDKPLRAEETKVRVRADLYATITEIAEKSPAGLGLSRTAIVAQALELWLSRREGQDSAILNPATTPRGGQEQRLTEALLLFLGDKSAVELHDVVEVLLRRWLGKVGKKHAHQPKKDIA